MVDDLQIVNHEPNTASTGNQAAFLAIVSSRNFPDSFLYCMHSFLQLQGANSRIFRKEKFCREQNSHITVKLALRVCRMITHMPSAAACRSALAL
jgi:hypothetical protein